MNHSCAKYPQSKLLSVPVMELLIALLLCFSTRAMSQQFSDSLQRTDANDRILPNDSMRLYLHDTIGDILMLTAGARQYNLGNRLQPGWIGFHFTDPARVSLRLVDGPARDPITGMPDLFFPPMQDAANITVYSPAHSFWYGGNGTLLAVDVVERDYSAPTPFTRLRHTESSFDYLFTDVVFSINPGDENNLALGVTRRTIGSTANNTARYRGEQAESWDLRARFRWDVAAQSQLIISNRYHDYLRHHHGGVMGWLNSNEVVYPDRSTGSFSDTAFNPILASLINPDISSRTTANNSRIEWRISGIDSSNYTSIKLTHSIYDRSYSDGLHLGVPDSLGIEKADTRSMWNEIALFASHERIESSLRFTASGEVSRYTLQSAVGSEFDGLRAMGRSSASLNFAEFTLTLRGRMDHQYDRTAFGLGAMAMLDVADGLATWAGVSFTERIPTLFELQGLFPRVTTTMATDRPLAQIQIAEIGARWTTAMSHTKLLFHLSKQDQGIRILHQLSDPIGPAGYRRFLTQLEAENESRMTAGISLDQHLRLWVFQSQSGLALTFNKDGFNDLSTPFIDLTSSLFYRGSIISQTLDLKLGGSFTYGNAHPLYNFNPETGVFGLPFTSSAGAESYTAFKRFDLFLFAVIKNAATVFLELHNLLDERYITTQFYPMEERSFRFGVDWTLWE